MTMATDKPGKPSLLRTFKAVAWSFVGLRSRGAYEEDIKNLSPIHIIVVGLVAVVLFVTVLVLAAKWAVAA